MVKRKRKIDPAVLEVTADQFVQSDDNAKMFGAHAAILKGQLMEQIVAMADAPDEAGHQYVELSVPIKSITTSGKGVRREEMVTGFKRERRAPRSLDTAAAEAWLKKHKFWNQVVEEIVTYEINEQALWQLVFDGKVERTEIDALMVENESFALVRVTEPVPE